MFRRITRYYKYPEFKQFTDGEIDIISRYIYAQPYISDHSCGISFVIEEESKLNKYEDSHILTKQLFNKQFMLNELPNDMQVIVAALSLDQVNGNTSQVFIEGLFFDLVIVNNRELIELYFPDWKNKSLTHNKDLENQLLELRKEVKNANFK